MHGPRESQWRPTLTTQGCRPIEALHMHPPTMGNLHATSTVAEP